LPPFGCPLVDESNRPLWSIVSVGPQRRPMPRRRPSATGARSGKLGGFRTFPNGPETHHRSSGQTGARAAAVEHGRGQAPPGSAGSRPSGRYPSGKCRRIMTGAVAV
jgi:hypothetical protein